MFDSVFLKTRQLSRSDFFLPILFIVALLLASIGVWNQPYDEVGDQALIGLQVERAADFIETVGPYSRVGFRHPGPVSFYYYALTRPALSFVSTMGHRYEIAQLLLNAVLFLWTLRLFRQIFSGIIINIYSLLFLVAVIPLGGRFWFSIWGPHALMIPYLLFFAGYLGLSRGKVDFLLPAIVAAVLILQNHISGLTLLLPMSVLVAWQLFRQRDSLNIRQHRISIFLTVAFLIITSIPPLIDQFWGTKNLTQIFEYFTGQGSASRRFDAVLLYLTGYYLDPVKSLIDIHSVVWFGILTGIPLLVWDRLEPIWQSLFRNLLFVFVLSFIAAMRISGDLLPHLFWHLYSFVAFHFLLVLVAISKIIPSIQIQPKWLRLHIGLFLMLLVATVYRPYDPKGYVLSLFDELTTEEYSGPYRLVFGFGSKDHNRWVEAAGIALKLVREGQSYCIDQEWEFLFPVGAVCSDEMRRNATVVRITGDDANPAIVVRPQ